MYVNVQRGGVRVRMVEGGDGGWRRGPQYGGREGTPRESRARLTMQGFDP